MKTLKLENLSDDELLNISFNYSELSENFDATFTESLSNWLDTHDELTENQRASLIHVIKTHHMEF